MKNRFSKVEAIVCLIFLSISAASFGQSKKELIVGRWQFEKFASQFSDADLAPEDVKIINKANKANAGLVITFTADNKFRSDQKAGMQVNNSSGTYSLIGNDRLVIKRDTSFILQLDKSYLKLTENDKPVIIFKRLP